MGLINFLKMNPPQIGSGTRSMVCGDTQTVHFGPVVVKANRADSGKEVRAWKHQAQSHLLPPDGEDVGFTVGASSTTGRVNLIIRKNPSSSGSGRSGRYCGTGGNPRAHSPRNQGGTLMPKKCEQSSRRLSTLAAKTLANPKSPAVAKRLAGSVLTQAPNKRKK